MLEGFPLEQATVPLASDHFQTDMTWLKVRGTAMKNKQAGGLSAPREHSVSIVTMMITTKKRNIKNNISVLMLWGKEEDKDEKAHSG